MRNRSVIFSLLVAILLLTMSGTAAGQVRVGVAIAIAPPAIPVYEQPICPGDGYIWTPGYWAYDDDDYYWVPGTWVEAPEVGYLWTPGYWAWGGDGFVFTAGYWGPVVGFYGGINYGFGYFGHGYEGGRWENRRFYYNTTVNRVNVEVVHNVYNTRVNETTVSHVSYNGGNGGINARPRPEEAAAARGRHIAPVSSQIQHERGARSDRQQWASINHGAPAVAATPRPGGFKDRGVVTTREAGGPYKPALRPENNGSRPDNRGSRPDNNVSRPDNNAPRPENNSSRPVIHPNDMPHVDRAAPSNTGNSRMDQKYQQQQEKLQTKQQKDLQKLQQKQEQEHQQMAKQANQAKQQQMEQRHQQQTQQLQQKHAQQAQQMHQRQQPPAPPHGNGNKPPQ